MTLALLKMIILAQNEPFCHDCCKQTLLHTFALQIEDFKAHLPGLLLVLVLVLVL